MNFYEFRQNNSGGGFDHPALYVFIEAMNAEEANEKAASVGIYFDGVDKGLDCDCCGDRWYEASEYQAVPAEYWKDRTGSLCDVLFRNLSGVYDYLIVYADGRKVYGSYGDNGG